MSTIKSVSGFEVLDSRGRPTILAHCTLYTGESACASVPSGASTGTGEALELRDHDSTRFGGYGCLKAVEKINKVICPSIRGQQFATQKELDHWLIQLDGTENKTRLGANSLLAVSLSFAKVNAKSRRRELFQHLSETAGITAAIPSPMVNLFSGGKHGGNQTAIQDLQLLLPKKLSVKEGLKVLYDVFHTAAQRMNDHHGMRLLRADEGGLAPPFNSSEDMFVEAIASIEQAGYIPGKDIFLTVDVAASHFYDGNLYHIDGKELETGDLINLLSDWCKKYPIVSIEDGLDENDWQGWSLLMQEIGHQTMILGDDLLCTNPFLIQRAIHEKAANSLLLKVNQIGTLTEAFEAFKLARTENWKVVASARSGETEDSWLADLATAWAADYIKIGSITQSDRLAKYNRLLIIEAQYFNN